jgi:hypothetical protein
MQTRGGVFYSLLGSGVFWNSNHTMAVGWGLVVMINVEGYAAHEVRSLSFPLIRSDSELLNVFHVF